MDTDSKAEVIAQIARLDELIDKSTQLLKTRTPCLTRAADSFVRQSVRMLVEGETTA
jgi:hypothetical protein